MKEALSIASTVLQFSADSFGATPPVADGEIFFLHRREKKSDRKRPRAVREVDVIEMNPSSCTIVVGIQE